MRGKDTVVPYNPSLSHLIPGSANLFLVQRMGRIPMETHLCVERLTALLPLSPLAVAALRSRW